jgi:hypothetical protein
MLVRTFKPIYTPVGPLVGPVENVADLANFGYILGFRI